MLFESLCKQTPACDDPVAHDEIHKVLIRLREMTDEVNKATDNSATRQLVETTWALQDRLVFDESAQLSMPPAVIFRLLGRVTICGVLHVAFESRERVKGQYVICLLYRSCILLATMNKTAAPYNVLAILPLVNGSIDEPDNGRGTCLKTR